MKPSPDETSLRRRVNPETSFEFVTLARVVKTQGRRGEVAAEVHTGVPDRFVAGMKLLAWSGDEAGSRRELTVEEIWPHKEWLVFKFEGVNSISEAEALVRCELQVPWRERAKLEQGWSFISDLAGCEVFDGEHRVGVIADVQFGAGEAPLLMVRGEAGKQYEIPFAETYLKKLDTVGRRVNMELPEGLLELNAPLNAEEKQEQARSRNEA